MLVWDSKRWRNPPRNRNLGPDFKVINLFYSPSVRKYLENHDRRCKFSRWGQVLATPSAFQLIINKRLAHDCTDGDDASGSTSAGPGV